MKKIENINMENKNTWTIKKIQRQTKSRCEKHRKLLMSNTNPTKIGVNSGDPKE